MSTPPAGPAAAAVRGRSRHEDVRQSQSQRQPAHLPPQQEVLQEVTGEGGTGGDANLPGPLFSACMRRASAPIANGLELGERRVWAPQNPTRVRPGAGVSPARAEAAAAAALQRSF